MASWGLAFQYGKKAYEDMWRQQEENDRLAANRELYMMQLQEEKEALTDAMRTNREVRAGNAAVTKNKKRIASGGEDGVKAMVDFYNEVGMPAQYIGDRKIKFADGTVKDFSGKEWTGSAMLAEVYKVVPSAANMSAAYTEGVKDDLKAQRDWDKSMLEYYGKINAAQIAANSRMQAAALTAKGLGGMSDALVRTAMSNTKDFDPIKKDYAIKAMFGGNAVYMPDEQGVPSYYMRGEDGNVTKINLNERQAAALVDIENMLDIGGNNFVKNNNTYTAGLAAMYPRAVAHVAGLQKKWDEEARLAANAETLLKQVEAGNAAARKAARGIGTTWLGGMTDAEIAAGMAGLQ